MTTPRRGLRLCASIAVVAVALGAAVGGTDALVAWSAQADATELQERYRAADRTLATERAILADFHAGDRRGTTRAGYTRAAAAASRALARAAEHASADAESQLTRLVSTHQTATRSARRALAGAADSPRWQPELRRATRLLDQVARTVETLAASSVAAAPAPWPRSPRGYVGLLAVALAALAGIATMGRRAIELVTTTGPPTRRSSDHELARLVTEARTDNLTRLGNHRAFHDDLAAEIEKRNSTGSHFSLMAIDLDGLKAINDTHGHQAGDAHIVRLAQGVKTVVGSSGTVYRTGGDEFMVLLPGIRNWHAINLAQRIIGATKSGTGRTLSIGVTETNATEHRQALVRQADLALYEAKGATLGIVPFRPGMEPAGAPARADGFSQDQRALAAALARAVDARDLGTHSHAETVAELASGIGARLGLQGHHLERLRVAALLHDVGKIAVADAILHKQTRLAPSEQDEMRDHIAVGRDILVAASFIDEATWVYHHHEHYDGTGHPDGLSGDAIPLESRIIAVADTFEAMTGGRPYRENVSTELALAELSACAGSQFDPSCVRILAELVGDDLHSVLIAPLHARSSAELDRTGEHPEAEPKLIA